MKVKGLNGREYIWDLGKQIYLDDRRKRSKLHLRCRAILNTIFPLLQIYEEVSMPGSNHLTLDFYIPNKYLAIECQGEQHYKFIPHFHKHIEGFMNSKKRDQRKHEWCQLNDILLVTLPYNEDDNEWRNRIENN